MPELPLCKHCKKPIYKDDENYVVLNRELYDEKKWIYAHADCQRDSA